MKVCYKEGGKGCYWVAVGKRSLSLGNCMGYG